MDRDSAARLLGVPAGASPEQVESAFRARVRLGHPDRFPPGSDAGADATRAMQALTEARRTLVAPSPARAGRAAGGSTGGSKRGSRSAEGGSGGGTAGGSTGGGPEWTESRERSSTGFRGPRETDRAIRSWGLGWGGFLLVAAVVSFLIGAAAPTNDALPVWSPALALIGLVAITLGWRADHRLRPPRRHAPGPGTGSRPGPRA